jgi:glutathione S-transferase
VSKSSLVAKEGGKTMIELYDLCGANDLRFSPYCWRTKAVLTYKKIPFSTIPMSFTEKDKIAFSGQDRVPVIKDDGTVVSDSWSITKHLEEKYPDPKIFPTLGIRESCRFFNLFVDNTVHGALIRVVLNDIFAHIQEKDRAYFRADREQRFGMTLEQIAAQRDEKRSKMQEVLSQLEETLAGQEYFYGQFTYADLCLFGTFKWVTTVSKEPFFDKIPKVRAWWERMQKQLGI